VWFYKSSVGFINGNDKTISNHSGSVVLPFLKNMADRYPAYNFCGIKYGHACGQAFHILTEENHKRFFVNKIAEMRRVSRIGGIMLMYGYIEGRYPEQIEPFGRNLATLIDSLRSLAGDPTLPVIIGRYELNGSLTEAAEYRRYDRYVVQQIESVPRVRQNVALAPFDYIPKEYYCDNHHYTAEGYKMLADDACQIYENNGWDFWNKRNAR
jgi:hypothetical protein